MEQRKLFVIIIISTLTIGGILIWMLSEQKAEDSVNTVRVEGSVIFDSGGSVEGAIVKGRTDNDSSFTTEAITDTNGDFSLMLTVQHLPTRILIEIIYQVESIPTVENSKWLIVEEEIQDLGFFYIPNPVGTEITITSGAGENDDQSIRVRNLPDEVGKFFGRSYDPDEMPEIFPGEFAESGGLVDLESAGFLWMEATDAFGNSLDQLSSPMTISLKIPKSQWSDLMDIEKGTERIEIPIYDYNEDNNTWEWGDNMGWLVDSNGCVISEDYQEWILTGIFHGDIYTVFKDDHLSWKNIDFPWIGPWGIALLDEEKRSNECFITGLNLAKEMAFSSWGEDAFEKVKGIWELSEILGDGKGPQIDLFPKGAGDCGGFWGHNEDYRNRIRLNPSLWGECSSWTDFQKKSATLAFAYLTLHETAHWMDYNYNDNLAAALVDDEGDQLEIDIFGYNLGLDPGCRRLSEESTTKYFSESEIDTWLNPDYWRNAIQNNGIERNNPSYRTIANSPLTLTISLSQSSYTASEPVLIDIEFMNDGTESINVLNFLILENHPIRFRITHLETGSEVEFRGPEHDLPIVPENFTVLAPGELLTKTIDLRFDEKGELNHYDLSQGGMYEIQAIYSPSFGLSRTVSNILTFDMQGGGHILGSVTNLETASPISGATVTAIANNRAWDIVSTNTDGSYTSRELPPGLYTVKVSAPDYYITARRNIEVIAERNTTVHFDLSDDRIIEVGQFYDGSYARDVTIKDSYAYLADGRDGLEIIDISDVNNPVEAGQLIVGREEAYAIAVDGQYAYVAAEYDGLLIVDISTPTNPVKVGQYDDDGKSTDVIVKGSYAYVVEGSGGLEIIDITDPINPIEVGEFDEHNYAYSGYSLAIDESYLYLADGYQGLKIIDISDPTKPIKVGEFDDGGSSRSVAVINPYLYIADESDGLEIIDISNPTDPLEIGQYDDGMGAYAIEVIGTYAYMTQGYQGLKIIDISNPSKPIKIGEFDDDGSSGNMAVFGSYAYIAESEYGLEILDISDPTGPVEVGEFDDGGLGISYGVDVVGFYAYVADGGEGLEIFDISDPYNPVQVGEFNDGGYSKDARGVTVVGSFAYLAEEKGGLEIINVSDPTNPLEVGQFSDGGWAWNVAVEGNYAFLADGSDGLEIIDISNPTSPLKIGQFNDGMDAHDVTIVDSYAYVSDFQEGLKIIDISDPYTPVQVGGFYDGVGTGHGITVVESYVFMADGNDGFEIIDISDPYDPIKVGKFDDGGVYRDIVVIESLAYIAKGSDGLEIIDCWFPSLPVEIVQIDDGGSAYDIAVSGSYAYVADGSDGLEIIQIS